MTLHLVQVGPLPEWLDHARLLGEGSWTTVEGACFEARLGTTEAAYLQARLRRLILDGMQVEVRVRPSLKRPVVRAARTRVARDMRDTTPGFERAGTQLDDASRAFLTPETLALEMARAFRGRHVLDAGCGAGGNAIAFARCGCRVTAVDHSAERLEQARHNARVYGVHAQIDFHCGDARDAITNGEGEVLFVDPPWGHLPRDAAMGLADLPLLQFAVIHWRSRFAHLVVKAPPALATQEFGPSATARAVFGERYGDSSRIKFLVIRDDA